VRPFGVGDAQPRDVRPELLAWHAGGGGALDAWAVLGGKWPSTSEALVEVLLVEADGFRHGDAF
jgi:hypothetical protein